MHIGSKTETTAKDGEKTEYPLLSRISASRVISDVIQLAARPPMKANLVSELLPCL